MTHVVFRASVLVTLVSGLASCAANNAWDYKGKGPVNLVVKAAADSGSIFSKRSTNIAIHQEVARCQFEYAGSIVASETPQSSALPTGQRLLIQFNFISQSRLDTGSYHEAIDKLFIARAGSQYEIVMGYGKNEIQYEMVEVRANGRRHIPSLSDPSTCK